MTTTGNPTMFDLGEGRLLEVNVTEEGIIMDLYDGADHLGTFGMMADELAEQLIRPFPTDTVKKEG